MQEYNIVRLHLDIRKITNDMEVREMFAYQLRSSDCLCTFIVD